MKSPAEAAREYFSSTTPFVEYITARDAEHRAELAAAQATIEQLGKDGAAIAEKLDRAVELLRAAPTLGPVYVSSAWDGARCVFLASLLPPPPAESTPVPSCVVSCTKCSYRAVGLTLDEAVLIDDEHKATHTISPPDDIRERLEGRLRWHDQQFAALDKRLAALEAKGEPGTHAKGAKP